MIKIKSPHEIKLMAEAGQIAELARRACGELVAPGITTRELDHAARKVIEGYGAKPSFLGYGGFPGSICCSINDEVIHGIPGSRKVKQGDIVKIDVGALYMGYHGDCAATYAAGAIPESTQKLIQVTRQSFYEGIKYAREGYRISDISRAIDEYTVKNGFSGAGLCRTRRRKCAARGARSAEFPGSRPGRTRSAAGGRHDHRHRADGEHGHL